MTLTFIDTYTELGYNVLYNLRTRNLQQTTYNNMNLSIDGTYSVIYIVIDEFLNIGYNKRVINVIKYNIQPIVA